MPEKTIVDASLPNAGRIYDYLLGGHHSFEVDRRAGNRIKEVFPILPTLLRLMRWCLQDVARELTHERGFDTIIDFASGQPTQDHIHTAAAPGTTIIYSDRDPVCVEYGREILGNTPGVHYFQADCRSPEELLNRPEVLEILGEKRHVAVIYWGIVMYLTNEEIARAARKVYDWSDEESCLAFYFPGGNPDEPALAKMMDLYRQMGEELYFSPLEVYTESIKPWRPDELGYRTMEEWHGIELAMSEEDIRSVTAAGGGYGVYLVK